MLARHRFGRFVTYAFLRDYARLLGAEKADNADNADADASGRERPGTPVGGRGEK